MSIVLLIILVLLLIGAFPSCFDPDNLGAHRTTLATLHSKEVFRIPGDLVVSSAHLS